jgi:hypothetical protein
MTPPRVQARVGLLDSVIILILACMLVLIVLWISGQLRGIELFGKLPDWLTKVASSIWTYVTGAGSSALLALVRRRSGDPTPNYLLWIFGTAIVMLLIVFGVGIALTQPQYRQYPPSALLRFWLSCDQKDHPNLSFFQKHPRYKEAHTIAAESDGHYQEYVDLPSQDGRFYARVVRVITSSQATNDPLSSVTEFCFKRSTKPPGNETPKEARMDCSEGKRCSIRADDPGWVELCSADGDWTVRTRIIPVVYADAPKVQPGWKVPSLETLRKMTDRERVGYTEFSLKSTQLSGLKEADSLQYMIKVNGSPLYVDGWAPEDMLKPFDAGQGFTFSFGLENLSFSGADNGCENIEVGLSFRQKDRVIKHVVVSRKYAALRDADLEEVKGEDGTPFAWSGKYVKPKQEDRTEVFVLSTPDLREARSVKARIDAAKLSYDGMEVVGVLRPPLNNPQYGIVVGLRQSTGQIHFTYDAASAQKMHDWIISQHAKNANIFRHDTFLYQMKPGESGTGTYKSCSIAAQKP